MDVQVFISTAVTTFNISYLEIGGALPPFTMRRECAPSFSKIWIATVVCDNNSKHSHPAAPLLLPPQVRAHLDASHCFLHHLDWFYFPSHNLQIA